MIIYQIKNENNGKLYIGKHKNCNSNEELQKSKYWGSGKLIKKAVEKYGKESFERKVLLNNIFNSSELNYYEILLIKENKSHVSEGGYNLTWGGDGLVNPTEETIKLMSDVHKGQHSSPKTEFKKGLIPWIKGKKHPKNIREKISEKVRANFEINPNYGMRGKRHKEITKYKLSLMSRGKHRSPNTEFKKGQVAKNKGIAKTKETKEKIKKTIKDRYPNGRIPWNKGKKGVQISTRKGKTLEEFYGKNK